MYNLKYFLQLYTYGIQELPQLLKNSVYALRFKLQHRYIFNLHRKNREYHGRKLVGFSSEQMFDVVADVKNYKHFVPFCKKSVILSENDNFLKAALEVGFPPISESYTSRVTMMKPHLIRAVCADGRLFNHLVTTWKFSPGLRSNPQSCIIDFHIDFEFKSVLHRNLGNVFFDTLVKQMEGAFLVEAKRRYGPETLPSHPLAVPKS